MTPIEYSGSLPSEGDRPDDVIHFDGKCPHCFENADVGEIFDGEHRNCANCGGRVCGVSWNDGTFSLVAVDRGATDRRTGRQRTRNRWARQGRR